MPPLICLFLLGKHKEMCFKDAFYSFSLIIVVRTSLWNLIDIVFDNILLYLLCNIFLGKHVSPDIPYFKFHTPDLAKNWKLVQNTASSLSNIFISISVYVCILFAYCWYILVPTLDSLWVFVYVHVYVCMYFVFLCFWMRM